MLGKIERIEHHCLFGWIMDEKSPDKHVTFHVFLNDTKIGACTANITRKDLVAKKIGNGDHAFKFELDAAIQIAAGDVLSLRSTSRNQHLVTSFTAKEASAAQAKPKKSSEPTKSPAKRDTLKPDNGTQVAPSALPLPVAVPQFQFVTPKPTHKKNTYNYASLPSVLPALMLSTKMTEKDASVIIEQAFKAEDWPLTLLLCETIRTVLEPSVRILGWHGRALIYLGRFAEAATILEQARALDPDKHGVIFYLGIAYSRLSRWQDAAAIFEHCIVLQPEKEAKYYLELGRSLQRIGFGSYGVFSEDRSILPRAAEMLHKATQLNEKDVEGCRELAMLYVHMQRYDDALNTISLAITRGAQHVNAWLDYTRILVRLHRIEEAFEACKKTLKLAPQNDTCKFNHRLISRLVETTKPTAAHTISIITLTPRTPKHECVEYVQQHDATRWVDAIFNASSRWIIFEDGSATKEKEALQLLECSGFEWAACVTDSRTPQLTLWRRDFLISLLHTGSIGLHAPLSRLLALAKTYGRTSTNHPNTALDMRAWKANGRTVLLFSQYGIRKFGGGEHFLQQMAHIYKAMGFDVLVIGTQAEFVGEEGEVNGLRYRFIDRSPEEFIRLVFDEKAVLCHMISGLAFEVTNALRYFNISIIHGIHFWRDMMAPPTPSTGYYPDVDVVETQGRLEFNGVIRDSEVVYANSLYTRKEVERLYGMCAPIIYSLPDPAPEEAQGKVTATGRDYVLLANARVDKGYDIFIKTAQLLPHIRFCAIASQSSHALAQSMLDVAGVTNVELLDHVSDMTTLYKEARVVAVPSYKFIETFSRVVIEAQRFGVPVIGSDRGNVPYLLIESGISLPEDAALWAKEIEQLFADDAYWQKRSRMALENSERYSFDMQHVRLSNIVSAVEKPVLVGVGSGLGNIIHTAPVIRNIALRTGRPVDVVMAGDHTDMLFVLANRNYVNHVFVLNEDVMNRRYEAVFLTHSFGTAIPKFSTNRLLISRNWRDFHPGNELHEAEFNLAAAKQLLGVDYAPEDVNSYFLGDYVYERPAEVFVGLHAGSKGGIWGAKRWPHYDVLAKRLMAAGIRVASFGTPDEYVVGTENRTGGTIEQMTRAMLSCSHFVSNDSGVMNIANALGIPLVALFAPTNIFTRGPLAPTSQAIAIEKDCSPCELDRKPDSRFNTATCDCIKEINVQDVTKALGLTV